MMMRRNVKGPFSWGVLVVDLDLDCAAQLHQEAP